MSSLRLHTGFSLAALCAMLILPFLNPHHYNPVPTFFQEWTAGICALLAGTLLLRKTWVEKLEIPEIALLPLGLAALMLIQYSFGKIAFLSQALLVALFLLWAMLILTLGGTLRRHMPLEKLANVFAGALLCGSLLAVILLSLQLAGQQSAGGLLSGLVSRLVLGTGNLAQANHLANYLWLGIASAIYLYAAGRIGRTALAASVLMLLSAASLTGSRSVILYSAGFAVLSLWSARQFHQAQLRRIAGITLLILPATLVLQFLFSYFGVGSSLQTAVSGERFFQEVSGSPIRLQLWRTGLAIFAENPWLGAGIGQFPYQAYLTVGAQPDGSFLGGGEHAHNLLIHLLCELGVFAPLLLIVLAWRWWLGFVRQSWSVAHWWIAAVLLVLATHSQLEYPLWYAFFLGIAALILGLGNPQGWPLRISVSGRAVTGLILLLGAVSLVSLFGDYRKLERTLHGRPPIADGQTPSLENTLDELSRLHRESLFGHYVPLSYAYQLAIDRQSLRDKITVSEMAIRFSPVDLITYKLPCLLALDGRHADARTALQRAVATHPGDAPAVLEQYDILAVRYPEISWLRDELRRLVARS